MYYYYNYYDKNSKLFYFNQIIIIGRYIFCKNESTFKICFMGRNIAIIYDDFISYYDH